MGFRQLGYPLKRWSAGLLIGLTLGCATPTLKEQGLVAQAPADLAVPPTPTPAPTGKSSVRAATDLSPLKNQLQDYLGEQEGTYGVYVIDLATGKGVGINGDEIFPAASTFKLPMAMYILDMVERGEASLDEKLTYTDSDAEYGTGILQDSVGEGDQFEVRNLVELAIEQSDNIATNMLIRHFGIEHIFAFMHKLGGKVTFGDDDMIATTPREMASYMRLAQGSKTISNTKLRGFLLESLSKTAFDDRAAAGVPQGVKVAHKIGTLPGVVNDIALVYAPKRTFIVSVFSKDVDDSVAPEVIASVTRQVYEFEMGLRAGT